jgi:hypothetical protein
VTTFMEGVFTAIYVGVAVATFIGGLYAIMWLTIRIRHTVRTVRKRRSA